MSMSVGGIGGYGGIGDYWDLYAGRVSAEDAADMADAVDFNDNLDEAQNVAGVQAVEQPKETHARIEPTEGASNASADFVRGDLSHIREDMTEIQGSLWGFSVRRVIPLAGSLQ